VRALRTAASGMLAQQLNVDVISNNIANMNTVGFKRQRAEFQDLLYQNVARAGTQSSASGTVVPTGVQVGSGVRPGAVYRILEQGTVTRSDNPFDIAIQGAGYLQVTMPSGETAYTRAGNLSTNAEGQLVTHEGYLLQPGITVPEGARQVTIAADGQVQVAIDGQTEPQTVGQIELAAFLNEAGLEAMGGNLFMQSGASGAPQTGTPGTPGFGRLLQNYTEASNVDAVSEITALITAQRAYEMNSKVISAADEMLSTANQLKQ